MKLDEIHCQRLVADSFLTSHLNQYKRSTELWFVFKPECQPSGVIHH